MSVLFLSLGTEAPAAGGGVTTPSRMVDSAADGDGPVEVDMRHYNNMMSAVPLESTSIPLMMHCMLEQVSLITAADNTSVNHVPLLSST